MSGDMVHMLRSAKPGERVTRCGLTNATTTVWWSDVTCPECVPEKLLIRSENR